MKILNAAQIREADEYTIANEPVKSIDLMERAALACTIEIISMYDDKRVEFFIFCGTGNNGGDGLAIARLLYDKGYNTKVFILDFSSNSSDNFLINKDRLKQYGVNIINFSERELFPVISSNVVIIDAIFGTGLNRPVGEKYATIIHCINKKAEEGVPVISIDLPSGLFDEDNSSNILQNIIRATYTLTFQAPKLAFMFPENEVFTGEWKVLDISLDKNYISRIPTNWFFTDPEIAVSLYKRRNKFSHKGTFGHSLIVAGSYGKMGAAILAAKACLRSGTGLLTTHVPKEGYQILQTTVPESMVSIDRDEKIITTAIKYEKYAAIGIGPGLGTEKETQQVIKMLIQNAISPILIDADGINILSENKTWLSFLPPNTILTPHLKEFERLVGKTSNSYERLSVLRKFSEKYNVIVILKGAHTAIALPNNSVYFNSTGNPGMATGGTGDVLSGVITGLLSQGYNPADAALFGVFLHGLAGDLASGYLSEDAMIASDIIEYLPMAFQKIAGKN